MKAMLAPESGSMFYQNQYSMQAVQSGGAFRNGDPGIRQDRDADPQQVRAALMPPHAGMTCSYACMTRPVVHPALPDSP